MKQSTKQEGKECVKRGKSRHRVVNLPVEIPERRISAERTRFSFAQKVDDIQTFICIMDVDNCGLRMVKK